jgi:hypothetical protein
MADETKTYKHQFEGDGEFFQGARNALKDEFKKAATDAASKTRTELLAKLGLEDDDDLEKVGETFKSGKQAKTELDKAISANKKLTSALEEKTAAIEKLTGFRSSALKGKALAPFAKRFRDPEDAETFLSGRLTVSDDDKVTGPEGAKVDSLVDELLKAKPHLKNPDWKEDAGAGTKGSGKKTAPPADDDEPSKKTDKNGSDPKAARTALAAELQAKLGARQDSGGP